MNLAQLVKNKREDILRIAAERGAHNLRIFGSVARGDADEKSDIDFLIELERGRTLRDHMRLIRELQELLGCKVDVATVNGLKPRIRERVLQEAIPL